MIIGAISLIAVLILIVKFYRLPLHIKIIFTIINSIVPDPIPVIDELLMLSGTLGHIMMVLDVTGFTKKHPLLTRLIKGPPKDDE